MCDRVGVGAPWPSPNRSGGVFAARGRRRVGEVVGGRPPGPCAAGIRSGSGPAPSPRGPGAPGEPASGGDRAGRVGLSWRWSVSAPAADPPGASTSTGKGGSGPVPGLQGPDRVGVQDRPRPLDSRRPVPSAPPGRSRKAAPGGRGGSPPPGGAGVYPSVRVSGTMGIPAPGKLIQRASWCISGKQYYDGPFS